MTPAAEPPAGTDRAVVLAFRSDARLEARTKPAGRPLRVPDRLSPGPRRAARPGCLACGLSETRPAPAPPV